MALGKRLVIYFFFDKDGIADRYVDYFLNGLKPVTDDFVIVANGKITPETRSMFLKYTDDIIVRRNVGLDVWAYKEALEYVGWDKLRDYYEVCLVNSTIMGPVYPFKEMFDKMSQNPDLDFWGINRHMGSDVDPFQCNPYGYLPEHIQSHFTVYRNRFLKSKELKQYWDHLPPISGYEDSVGKHESYFTKHFQDMGFIWTSYVHNQCESKNFPYYLLLNPMEALAKDRCPVFKRRSFFHDGDDLISLTNREQALRLISFLKEHTHYDVNMIYENIIRTCHQDDFVMDMGLFYILPSDIRISSESKASSAALVMHLYYKDLLQDSLHYAASMPPEADIIITTPHETEVDRIKEAFSILPNRVEVRLIENRGRDVSSLLVGAADVVDKYDYVCFFHDKKVTQLTSPAIGRSWAYMLSESVLRNRNYVENILSTFENHPKLGLLTPPEPYHSVYIDTWGHEWGDNFENTRELAEQLNLHVSMSEDKPPVAPLGTTFWFRTKAMKKLFKKDWKYTDFPKEPNKIDGTLLHALERVYPFVVQDAGYYPAYVRPDVLGGVDCANYLYYGRQFNRVFQRHGLWGASYQKAGWLDERLLKTDSLFNIPGQLSAHKLFLRRSKSVLRTVLPHPLYLAILKMKRLLLGPRDLPISKNQ